MVHPTRPEWATACYCICCNIDECSDAVTVACGDHAKCENMDGGYNCSCKEGYQPSTGKLQFKPNDGTSCQVNASKFGPFSLLHKIHPFAGGSYITCENMHVSTVFFQICLIMICDFVCCINTGNAICRQIVCFFQIRNIKDVLQKINQSTIGQLSPSDVVSYIELLSKSYPLLSNLSYTASDKEAVTNATLNVFINTVNNFIQKDRIAVWEVLPMEKQKTSLTKLMHVTEQATLLISQNYKKTIQLDVDTSTVAIVFLRYSNIGSLLSSSKTSSKESSEQTETVSSSVIAVAISANQPTLYQIEKITFTLKYAKTADTDIKCAFWNYSIDKMNGNWSTEGCELTHSNSTHTSCKCNHLTHFAVLMSSGGSGVTNYTILTRITQLGIIISLICLSMCIFTFWFFSEIQSTRTTIHKNLCCSLFLAELVFLVGINMNTNKLFCSITAVLLHYFLLAAFAWMCIEGIHLYLIVVGVIYNKGFLHKNFYIFGYVSPAVVVGISAALGYKYYGTTEVCWLSTKNNFIWSFIGPACLIILVNLMAFGVIIYKVFRHTAKLKPEVSCYENIRSCARGALALLFLLGATWIFGVLHVIQGSVVTAYLFTIFNAFQGMFIFIFLCVLSRKIQEEYYRLFKNVPCCFGCLR
uniref:Adhesion G protein-coupled receptor L4 n=1 Tax=Sphenodon punctatus TaxID=8508 RepID=A0A8D0H3Y5_SPHPU